MKDQDVHLCTPSGEEHSSPNNLGPDLDPGSRIVGSSQVSCYDVPDVWLDDLDINPGSKIAYSIKVYSIQNVPNLRNGMAADIAQP